MTTDQVRKKIKKKFGTYSKFAKAAGIDEYEFRLRFLGAHRVDKSEIHRIAALCESTNELGPEISADKIAALREAIESRGGVIQFCRDNRQFAEQSIFQILNGTRKKKTNKVQEVFDFLGVGV